MLWLLVILLIGGLSFVIFHKPHVNAMGAGWAPPRLDPPARPTAQLTGTPDVEDAVTLRLSREPRAADAGAGPMSEDAVTAQVERQPAPQAAQMPDTLDFNDLFGGTRQGPTDRPQA